MAETMRDMHLLDPCGMCPTRMAVPGQLICTVCEVEVAHEIATMTGEA